MTIPVQASGRYVRLVCHARATGYGSSLYEIEVYGSGRCDDPATAVSRQPSPAAVTKFIKEGQIYILRNGTVYTVDGMRCMQP